MIEFKQIIGRGTRLYDGKYYFTIYDFVKAMIETLPDYQDTNVATRQISLETIATPFIPLNAGAERAYKDAGVIK